MKLISMLALIAALWMSKASAQTGSTIAPIDGVGNNSGNPLWGSAGTELMRLAPPGYADGIFAPSLPGNLSARLISNILNNQAGTNGQDAATIDQNSLSDFGYAFGQFIDHDMDLTPDTGASFPISVPANDPIGPDPLPFFRSLIDPATGVTTPAQQLNMVTSYLDLSQVYGSSQVVADALRQFQGGQLKTSPGNMLPYLNSTYFTPAQIAALNMANDAHAVPDSELFATGDRRGNENLELTTLETLFVRNHNLLAAKFQSQHSGWSDEQLYQAARKLNIAQYQNVIYSEWLPAVLGQKALSPYSGYNPNVNASIANEFSTVAFRFGHSMLSADIERQDNDGQEVAPNVSLAIDFFNPHLLNPTGVTDPLTGLPSTDIGPVLKAEADANGQAMDLRAVSDVRDLLFGNGGLGGDDLMARDVQRGRDNGIPDYNTVRKALGLPMVTNFDGVLTQGGLQSGSRFSSRDTTAQRFSRAYPGGVNTLDLFEGGLAERHVQGSDVGPTFQSIIVDQFERLRDGDRFFYLNEEFTSEETNLFVQGSTLARIIMANTEITNLQDNVMLFQASISGTILLQGTGWHSNQTSVASGITVRLKNEAGDIAATTSTDQHGQYSFNQQSGPGRDPAVTPGVSGAGIYTVTVVVPRGMKLVSANPGGILISRGDTHISGVDFRLASIQTGPGTGTGGRR
jgi:hypothetical protein